jgi:type VII secretion integral membrane protein EccD
MSVVLPAFSDSTAPEPDPAAKPAARVSAVPEQVRVDVFVGRYFVEVSVSTHQQLATMMPLLVPFLADTLKEEGLEVDFDRSAIYSLAPEGGFPFPRTSTLAESGVVDGDVLILREIHSDEVFRPVVEDPADAMSEFNAAKYPAFSAQASHVLGLIALVAGSMLLAGLLLSAWWSTSSLVWWLPPATVLTLAAGTGAVVAQRRGATGLSYALGLAALPVAFTMGWVSVPAYGGVHGHWTAAHISAAIFTLAAASLAVWWLTGVGHTVHTALIALAVAGAAAAAARTFTPFDSRQIAAVAVLVGALLIVTAEPMALVMARVRPPTLPPPGEDIDRNELEEAGMTVEVFDDDTGLRSVELSDTSEDTLLERAARLSHKYLTGLYIAAAIIVAVSAITVIRPGTHYFYGEVALAVITVLVLGLRARSLTANRVWVVVFFLAAFVVAAGTALVAVLGTANPIAQISVIGGVAAAVVLSGLAALRLPGAKISELMTRRIENIEFLLIMVGPPLIVWITGAYSAIRNLV